MLNDAKKVLLVSAHADDMELGCGGTVHKLLKEGKDVYHLILSYNLKGASSRFAPEQVQEEVFNSARVLGLKRENILIEKFENRIFPSCRQDILDALWRHRRVINPDLVFTGALDDMHQDHAVVAQESFRAFKDINIISYGFDWNRLNKEADFYSVLSQEDLDKKIEAVRCYQSQVDGRAYFDPEYIKSWAFTRGVEIKERYAEAFNIIRAISR